MKYNRLSLFEREIISNMLFADFTYREIARELNRSPSTISREIAKRPGAKLNYVASICHKHAEKMAGLRNPNRKLDKNKKLYQFILNRLRKYWSPEQISNILKIKYPKDKLMQVSPETIYSYIYILPRGDLKKEIVSLLRHKQKSRKKRSNDNNKRGQIPDMISIDKRPTEVENRIVPGHWEGDLIVGKDHKSALGTIVERTTRTLLLVKLKGMDAETVRIAFAKKVKKLPSVISKSMTYDRGKEMSQHKLFTKETKMVVYFAHPYSPWERGTNENTNGLIRQFFPKGTDFNNVTRYQIKKVEKLLNERPRKVLNFETPKERMTKLLR